MKKIHLTYLFLLFLGVDAAFAQTQSALEISGKSAYIQAMEAFAGKEYEIAADLLLEAYNSLDGEAGVAYALADTYFLMNDFQKASHYGKQAVSDNPSDKWYRLKLAQIYRSAGQNQATVTELSTLLKHHPKDLDALYMLADTYSGFGEFTKANETLDLILRLTGPDIPLYLSKFENFEKLGATDSAAAQLELIRQTDPDNLHTLNILGEYYSKTGKDENAKNILNEALDRNSRDPQSLINLAEIYISESKWDSATSLLTSFISDPLVETEDKLSIAQFMYGKVQERPENHQLAAETEKLLNAFILQEADYGPALSLAGQFYAETGNSDKALEILKRATQLLPEDDIAWRQRLQILIGESRFDETIEAGKAANMHVPDDAFIQFFVGSAFFLKGQLAEAEEWLQQASHAPARRPFKSIIFSSLGDVQAGLNNFEDADKAYETALRYHPQNDNAMNNYAYHLSNRGEHLNRALELAQKANEADPGNSSYLDTLGWVYYKLGNYEQALEFIRRAVEGGNHNAEALEHLGDVHAKLGNLDLAKKWWKQALQKDESRIYLKQKIQ